MQRQLWVRVCVLGLLGSIHTSAGPVFAQSAPPLAPTTVCNLPIPTPTVVPPAGSAPVLYQLVLCFDQQGGFSLADPQAYLVHVQTKTSRPSEGDWAPFDRAAEQTLLADFQRLWSTEMLDDLSITVDDYPFANGTSGKLVVFHIEERSRLKRIDFRGLEKVDSATVDKELDRRSIRPKLDSFLDPSAVPKIGRAIRDLYAEKGFREAQVTHHLEPVPGGPKLVHLTFTVTEGPQTKILDVQFSGNSEVSANALKGAFKHNRPQGLFTFITGDGTYNEAAFGEDAESVRSAFLDRGYIDARVGQPQLSDGALSRDGKTRWVVLKVPVDEGQRHRIGKVEFKGNTLFSSETVAQVFAGLQTGGFYSDSAFRKGHEELQKAYGRAGHMGFTLLPELTSRPGAPEPTVDVTLQIDEGPRYTVNRLRFIGNKTTKDHVIRREFRVFEGSVFDTESLRVSLRRLNQLGYFKPIDDSSAVRIQPTESDAHKVDVEITVEEQNRTQVSFGAGVSQYDGFFGNLSLQTSNFMGSGETVSLTAQRGQLANDYQAAYLKPYVWNRPMNVGLNLFSRKLDYAGSTGSIDYSEVRMGGGMTAGLPLRGFTRVFGSYVYESVETAVSNNAALTSSVSSLRSGHFLESRFTPSVVHDTTDNPMRPRRGLRLDGSVGFAGGPLGGTLNFVKPEIEGVAYRPVGRRMAFGVRASGGWIVPYGRTDELPYYRRFFLGGENQIRGVNVRTVGPLDSSQQALGGNKFVLFNAEYYFDMFGPVRALLFHDAGQAFSEREPINLRNLRTSSGVELRFLMPVLNMPARLIYSFNFYRDSFQPARGFRFALGTAF